MRDRKWRTWDKYKKIMIYSDQQGLEEIYWHIGYKGKAIIIGNIYENTELLK